MVDQTFSSDLDRRWRRYEKGRGSLELTGQALRFVNRDAQAQTYSDAQIDDYQGLSRGDFYWHPPLTLTVRARFSHPCGELSGTAGFGFWNDPFMMTGRRKPTLPRAIWFFYASAPSNIKLDLDTLGNGWKAATIDAWRWPFFLLLPTTPLAIPLMNVRSLYRALWPIGQRAISVSEVALDAPMDDWHTYTIRWTTNRAQFEVDGDLALDCGTSPRGCLGFVAWLDNQYAVVTPWGRFGYGLLDAPGEQWMEIESLIIEPKS